MLKSRIILNILLILSFIYLPWQVYIFFVAAFIFFYKKPYEILFYGIYLDLAYSIPVEKFYGFEFIYTAVFLVMLILINFSKRFISFYR